MKVTLLHNPGAGKGEWTRERLAAAFRAAGIAFDYWSFDDDPLSHQHAFSAEAPIVVAGGDGAVAGVLKGLDDATRPVAVLPIGGSNNLARSLGLFGDVTDVIGALEHAPTCAFGLLQADGARGPIRIAEALGVGALNESMAVDDKTRSTEEKRENGRRMAEEAIRKARPIDARFLVDDRPVSEETLFVEALNVAMIGPHLALAHARHDAGPEFDVVWLPADGAEPFIRWLAEEADTSPAPLRRAKARRLSIEGAERIRIDDQFVENGGVPLAVSADPRAFKLLTPQLGRRND